MLGCSSFDHESVIAVWEHIRDLHDGLRTTGELDRKRSKQRIALLSKRVGALADELAQRPHPLRASIEQEVLQGNRETAGAAHELFTAIVQSAVIEANGDNAGQPVDP